MNVSTIINMLLMRASGDLCKFIEKPNVLGEHFTHLQGQEATDDRNSA